MCAKTFEIDKEFEFDPKIEGRPYYYEFYSDETTKQYNSYITERAFAGKVSGREEYLFMDQAGFTGRIYDKNGMAVADLLTKAGEPVDVTGKYRFVDPERPWKLLFFENCTAKPLQEQVVRNGEKCAESGSVMEIAEYVKHQLSHEIWPEEQRFENPHPHYLDMSPEYYEMKMQMLSHNGRLPE